MERKKRASLLLWTLVAGLLSQNLLIPVMSITSVEDQKNYYPPSPSSHAGSGSHGSPSHGRSSHGSGGSHGTPSHGGEGGYGSTPPSDGTPSHGGGGSYGGTPPSHHGGGGSYGGTPPSNCGNPPSGGHYDPTPAPPTGGSGSGGSSYYNSPPTTPPTSTAPPTPIITTPPTPIVIEPGTPSSPGISTPSPPFSFDPNSPPFPCNYWGTHPGLIWGVLGWFGTVGGAFGVASVPGFESSSLNLQQALSNARPDGFGALYREGTASLLNSMVDNRFPFTTQQVKDNFVAAISSNKAAAAQAHLFKLANGGQLKPRT